jgi:hypothetical protein
MDRRLPPHATRTLRALWRAVERSDHDQRTGLPRDHARRVVNDTLGERDEAISDEEIDSHLEFLRNHGEIYYVDDWVRITTPNEVAHDSATESEDADEEAT